MAIDIFSRLKQFFAPQIEGLRPPFDPPADGWTWPAWKSEMDKHQIPGWAFCRFAQRHSSDSAVFVFGLVRGPFGIFEHPFAVHHEVHGPGTTLLTTVAHLPSGMGIGTFDTMEHAAQACMAAEPICEDWNAFDPHNTSALLSVCQRMHTAWRFTGLEVADDKFARYGRETIGIWECVPHGIIQNRPEKLS